MIQIFLLNYPFESLNPYLCLSPLDFHPQRKMFFTSKLKCFSRVNITSEKNLSSKVEKPSNLSHPKSFSICPRSTPHPLLLLLFHNLPTICWGRLQLRGCRRIQRWERLQFWGRLQLQERRRIQPRDAINCGDTCNSGNAGRSNSGDASNDFLVLQGCASTLLSC